MARREEGGGGGGERWRGGACPGCPGCPASFRFFSCRQCSASGSTKSNCCPSCGEAGEVEGGGVRRARGGARERCGEARGLCRRGAGGGRPNAWHGASARAHSPRPRARRRRAPRRVEAPAHHLSRGRGASRRRQEVERGAPYTCIHQCECVFADQVRCEELGVPPKNLTMRIGKGATRRLTIYAFDPSVSQHVRH